MNAQDAEALLRKIEEALGDNETAHILQDDLYVAVLQQIALGRDDREAMIALARIACRARQIEFRRWYA